MCIEFKQDYSCALSPEQEEFRLACEAQRIEHYVVYSAAASPHSIFSYVWRLDAA